MDCQPGGPSNLQESRRQENQVELEEASPSSSTAAAQDPFPAEQKPLLTDIRQEEVDHDASLPEGEMHERENAEHPCVVLSEEAEHEEWKENLWNQDCRKRKKGNHTEEKRDEKRKQEEQTEKASKKQAGAQLKIHTKENLNKGSESRESFSQNRNISGWQTGHEEGRAYASSEPGEKSLWSSKLSSHQRIHAGEKLHKCLQCGKRFSRNAVLTSHQRTHTGEEPYNCTHCRESFSVPSGLVKHKIIHTAEKPYKCSVCKKSFIQRSELTSHQRSHTAGNPYNARNVVSFRA